MPGPTDMLLGLVGNLADGCKTRNSHNVYKDTVKNAEGREYIVDTCVTNDCGWETGVKCVRADVWAIPERYSDETSAKKGHEKWKKRMANEPGLFEKIKEKDLERYLTDTNFEG